MPRCRCFAHVPIGASLPDASGATSGVLPEQARYRMPALSRPMRPSPNPIRLLVCGATVAAIAIAGSGCGTTNDDIGRGRQLFIQKCGSCHVLSQAATSGTQGPSLDAAFAVGRSEGMDADTIAGIVSAQVENPRPTTANPNVSMPADLVSGQDLDDVAAYVAKYAGVPGAAPPKVPGGPGAQVFANNGCSGCHVLAAANAGGTTGPDLDKTLSGQSAAEIEQSIVDPNAKITPGYPSNVMPSNFQQVIPPDQLQQLVSYLVDNAGKK
jgi:mono/diheme cytochrome c family protein